jgi:hypothetical protein
VLLDDIWIQNEGIGPVVEGQEEQQSIDGIDGPSISLMALMAHQFHWCCSSSCNTPWTSIIQVVVWKDIMSLHPLAIFKADSSTRREGNCLIWQFLKMRTQIPIELHQLWQTQVGESVWYHCNYIITNFHGDPCSIGGAIPILAIFLPKVENAHWNHRQSAQPLTKINW